MEFVAQGISSFGELLALYELESSLCIGAIRSYFGDILGGGKFYRLSMKS